MLTDATRQSDFPALAGRAYLNTAAESIPPRCVGTALQRYWEDKQRGMGGRIAHFSEVERCREVSARFTGLAPSEIAFCSCSSEAYNLLASALSLSEADEVVVSDLDFPAGTTPWLRSSHPPVTKLWRAVEGELRPEDVTSLLSPRTRLVQISLVSFYNGARIDWPRLIKTVREYAPQAIVAVDVTQALGRVPLDCSGADILISSTHKWTLGIHGGCIVGIPSGRASQLTSKAGGWYHLTNAFDSDRFDRAVPKTGAPSFAVGMPNFAAIYALNASLRYLDAISLERITQHADPLVVAAHRGLESLGIRPLAPLREDRMSGIVAFRHPQSAQLHAELEREHVEVMHQAGRIRVSIHGYNTSSEVERLLETLRRVLPTLTS